MPDNKLLLVSLGNYAKPTNRPHNNATQPKDLPFKFLKHYIVNLLLITP